MAKVKAIAVGYYKHRLVQPGEIINAKEVDEKGFYVDKKGAQLKDKSGKPVKCKWLDHVSTEADKPIDPKEVAAVVSGKNPGNEAAASDDSEDAAEEPAKGK